MHYLALNTHQGSRNLSESQTSVMTSTTAAAGRLHLPTDGAYAAEKRHHPGHQRARGEQKTYRRATATGPACV